MSNTRTLSKAVAVNTVTLTETLTIGTDPTIGGVSLTATGGQTWVFDGVKGPLATASWHGQAILSSGALTLDLTALPDPDTGANVSMSGLKLKMLQIVADHANANPITVAPGATNGYTGWIGSAGHLLNASDSRGPDVFNGGIAVDGTHKTIDLAGTGSQKVVIVMLFG